MDPAFAVCRTGNRLCCHSELTCPLMLPHQIVHSSRTFRNNMIVHR